MTERQPRANILIDQAAYHKDPIKEEDGTAQKCMEIWKQTPRNSEAVWTFGERLALNETRASKSSGALSLSYVLIIYLFNKI